MQDDTENSMNFVVPDDTKDIHFQILQLVGKTFLKHGTASKVQHSLTKSAEHKAKVGGPFNAEARLYGAAKHYVMEARKTWK